VATKSTEKQYCSAPAAPLHNIGCPAAGPLPDLRSWQNFLKPIDELREGEDTSALYFIADRFEQLRSLKFDEAFNEMWGLYALLRHNPALRLEAQAVAAIWEGYQALSVICNRVNEVIDGPRGSMAKWREAGRPGAPAQLVGP